MPEKEYMLTTIDNPYNPFTHFEEWNAFDIQQGYNTCAYLGRIVESSSEMSDADSIKATNRAIEKIVKMNVLGIYKKVTAEDY